MTGIQAEVRKSFLQNDDDDDEWHYSPDGRKPPLEYHTATLICLIGSFWEISHNISSKILFLGVNSK
jgi:hypothetical protein